MWTFGRPRHSLNEAIRLGLIATVVALAALAALAAQAMPRATLPDLPRCYWISPPLADFQRELLNRGFLDCTFRECRATFQQSSNSGWVCFFDRPWKG